MPLAPAVRVGWATATLVLIRGARRRPTRTPNGESKATSAETSTAAAHVLPAISTRLGHFPAFPQAQLQDPVAASLQAALDNAVADGIVRGATAAVIVAGSGSWPERPAWNGGGTR